MNQRGVAALMDAAIRGVPQIRGAFVEGDGRCAAGVLYDAMSTRNVSSTSYFGLDRLGPCPECGHVFQTEYGLIVHLNDTHIWDFIKIAHTLDRSPIS